MKALMSKKENHKFGDLTVPASLTGGNLSGPPCPDLPQPRPHLQEYRQVQSDPWANPPTMLLQPQTAP